jgi:hypothetical protein
LGVAKKQLSEGEHMTEHGRKLGAAGLSYGTPAAEEMISDRMRKLAEKGQPASEARRLAVGQLTAEGNLRTLGPVTRQGAYLGEASEARRELSAAARRGQTLLDGAKREAAERGVSLSTVMNEKALKGEVQV